MSKQFIVETSARHIHVSEADLKVLFGENAQLTPKKDLSQPGHHKDQLFTLCSALSM